MNSQILDITLDNKKTILVTSQNVTAPYLIPLAKRCVEQREPFIYIVSSWCADRVLHEEQIVAATKIHSQYDEVGMSSALIISGSSTDKRHLVDMACILDCIEETANSGHYIFVDECEYGYEILQKMHSLGHSRWVVILRTMDEGVMEIVATNSNIEIYNLDKSGINKNNTMDGA